MEDKEVRNSILILLVLMTLVLVKALMSIEEPQKEEQQDTHGFSRPY